MKLVTAAQQLHGILDNTANNKVLECELRLYALQTILYDNITHVSPHVASISSRTQGLISNVRTGFPG